jgi:hypothetical protein
MVIVFIALLKQFTFVNWNIVHQRGATYGRRFFIHPIDENRIIKCEPILDGNIRANRVTL